MVDQPDHLGTVRDGAEQVHSPARCDAARRPPGPVNPVERASVELDLRLAQHSRNHQEPFAFELGALLCRHRRQYVASQAGHQMLLAGIGLAWPARLACFVDKDVLCR
jgi:hypothetical protein